MKTDGYPETAFSKRSRMLVTALICMALLFLGAPAIYSQEDIVKLVEDKSAELKDKEETLKKEEERLLILKKDVEDKINKYGQLLGQLEFTLKKVEQIQDARMLAVAKLYEGMSPEEAASKLTALDEETAVQIMLRMKSKKSGAIIALFEPKKAAQMTKQMARLQIGK
ncbi:MAG: hypothetical protein WC539_05145 [Nitrospirota bacterium]